MKLTIEVTVDVTDDVILNAVPGEADRCAVALAVRRAMPRPDVVSVVVETPFLFVFGLCRRPSDPVSARLPRGVVRRIKRFDRTGRMSPFRFETTLSYSEAAP